LQETGWVTSALHQESTQEGTAELLTRKLGGTPIGLSVKKPVGAPQNLPRDTTQGFRVPGASGKDSSTEQKEKSLFLSVPPTPLLAKMIKETFPASVKGGFGRKGILV
jgi:hypothetical protein